MATVVCSLGLSGVKLMSNMWRYPFTASAGGHITLRAVGGPMLGPGGELISYEKTYELVKDIYPEATFTSTLAVPGIVWFPWDSKYFLKPGGLVGRKGGFDTWYLNAPITKGNAVSENNSGETVFTLVGRHLERGSAPMKIPTRVATYAVVDGQETWNLVGVEEQNVFLIGTTGQPADDGLQGHLEVVQQLSHTPADRVTSVGVCLQGLQVELDDRVEMLRALVAEEMPGLRVATVDDFGEYVAADLVPLRDAAKKYSPVLLLISLQVVIATSLAIVHSRRQELSILRIIGFSYRRIWLLLTLECAFSFFLACALGLAGAKVAAYLLFESSAVSLAPFVYAFLASLIVSVLVGRRAVASSVPEVLRNA